MDYMDLHTSFDFPTTFSAKFNFNSIMIGSRYLFSKFIRGNLKLIMDLIYWTCGYKVVYFTNLFKFDQKLLLQFQRMILKFVVKFQP